MRQQSVQAVKSSYAATIGIMALFTVILEFDGGTYISQFRAASAQTAAVKHAAQLVGNEAVGRLATRKRIAHGLSSDRPVAIEGVRNVWCCSISIGKRFALVNIVATSEA
ncbi:MAG TPA: hypothetical protein VK738_07800 [Terriglobales bacterium]|nr:hypothetical protein [Terriglobales bacterium]